MIVDEKDENILYDTLNSSEISLLRESCCKTIRREPEPSFFEKMIGSCFSVCTCMSSGISGDEITEAFIEVSDILLKNSKVNKLFFYEADEGEIKAIAEAMYINLNKDYNDIEIKVLASSYRYYIKNKINKVIPNDIMMLLLLSYKNNDNVRKKECIKRIPFIMTEHHRLFFILLFKLMRSINENEKYSGTTFDELLDLFGPITIKNPSKGFQITGFIQKQILKDLSDVNFELVPKSYFNLKKEH